MIANTFYNSLVIFGFEGTTLETPTEVLPLDPTLYCDRGCTWGTALGTHKGHCLLPLSWGNYPQTLVVISWGETMSNIFESN